MALSWSGAYSGFRAVRDLGGLLKKGIAWVLPRPMNIAITGMQGVGKSVLYDYLSGKAYRPGYRPPLQSQKLERGKAKRAGKKIVFSVIPGQSEGAAPRLEAIDKVFGTGQTIDLLIHVVAYGFASIRTATGRETLIRELKINTVSKYRKHALVQEMQDLEETCKAIRTSHRSSRSPRMLLVAVDKVDLYHDKLDKAQAHYTGSDKPFVKRLNTLTQQVGTDHLAWDVAPVCAYLEPFQWHRQTVRSQIDAAKRDEYIANFLRLIESHFK